MDGVEEAEVKGMDGPGCCSTGPSTAEHCTSEEASSPPLSLPKSREAEEEREVVQEVVVEVEDWGDVSEEEGTGGGDIGRSDSGSEDSSPPAVPEAADAEVEATLPPPASTAPLLYSWYNKVLSFSSRVFMRLSTNSILGGPSLSDSATEEG